MTAGCPFLTKLLVSLLMGETVLGSFFRPRKSRMSSKFRTGCQEKNRFPNSIVKVELLRQKVLNFTKLFYNVY